MSALLCCITLGSISQPLTTSLTACYDLDGNASEPINSLTGTISVATATVDRFNNVSSALHFNGSTNCFVQLPEDPLLKPSPAISFALWVKPVSLAGGMHIVFTKNNQSSNFEAYQFEIFGGTYWRLNKANSTLNDIVLSTSTVVINQWYHIACTIDNTSLKLYVNGVLEGTTNSTFSGFDYMTGKKVYLGGTNESFNHPFIGTLDNLKFWNRVISPTEVTQLYLSDPPCLQAASISPELTLQPELSYFPNPVENVLRLRSQISQSVSLLDAQGHLLQRYDLKPGEPVKADLSGYQPGLYFLKSDLPMLKVLKIVKE